MKIGILLHRSFFATVLASTAFVSSSYATSFGIDAAYGSATHDTTAWQELNDINNNADSYGVYWSVDGGAYGREDIKAGKTVQFQVNMHKENLGTHYADLMKLWVDWDQDNRFDASDVVAFELKPINPADPFNPSNPALGTWKDPIVADYAFESIVYSVSESLFGDLSLRARVTCSESLLSSWGAQWTTSNDTYNALFSPTGRLVQGEVEDWTVSVTPVPEPATMLLFGTGLVGLVGSRMRKKKK